MLFVVAVRAALAAGLSRGRDLIIDSAPIRAWRRTDPDAASGHAPAHHPTPWLRVKLSCATGKALFPHPQWDRVVALWEALYPPDDLDAQQRQSLRALAARCIGETGPLSLRYRFDIPDPGVFDAPRY